MAVAETEWAYGSWTGGGTSNWNDIEVDPPLAPSIKSEVVRKPGQDGAWTYAEFLTELDFVLSGEYGNEDPDDAFTDFFETFLPAFAPQTTDQPLEFNLPGIGAQYVLCKPIDRRFNLNRLLSLGTTKWAVRFVAGDPTIHDGTP